MNFELSPCSVVLCCAVQNKKGWSPLHVAALHKHTAVVIVLANAPSVNLHLKLGTCVGWPS